MKCQYSFSSLGTQSTKKHLLLIIRITVDSKYYSGSTGWFPRQEHQSRTAPSTKKAGSDASTPPHPILTALPPRPCPLTPSSFATLPLTASSLLVTFFGGAEAEEDDEEDVAGTTTHSCFLLEDGFPLRVCFAFFRVTPMRAGRGGAAV